MIMMSAHYDHDECPLVLIIIIMSAHHVPNECSLGS
jgi:hypothetical protein